MAKDRSLVKASDIGAWTFCNRAWWLASVADADHEDPEALARGTRVHAAHGRSLDRATRAQRIGLLLAAIGLGVLILALAAWILY